MSTPFVPVPVPIGNSSSGSVTTRSQRSSSLGSCSSTSSSSKEPHEDAKHRERKKLSVPDSVSCASSICSSPLVRTKFDSSVEYNTRQIAHEHVPDSEELEERPSTPTILGYEVMEERAKFTIYKVLVRRSPDESWVVFRRYTDFSRLNDKLKEMFPGFRLALPPKRWFKDNYDLDFLEDRQLGLQAFLQNLVAHKDISNCPVQPKNSSRYYFQKDEPTTTSWGNPVQPKNTLRDYFQKTASMSTSLVRLESLSAPVRLFLCLDDPPGPFDSLEESRAFCETLEETNYRLQRDLAEKQKELETLKKLLNEKQLHIQTLESQIRDMNMGNAQARRPSREESECSGEVESSVIEADQGASTENGSYKDSHESCWSETQHTGTLPEIEVAEVADPDEEL